MHSFSRRHLSADVTTNIIFGIVAGVFALVSIIQVAVLSHQSRLLHCRLLHRDGTPAAPIVSDGQEQAQVLAAANNHNPTASRQSSRATSPRRRGRALTSTTSTASNIVRPAPREIPRQHKRQKPSVNEALLAVAALLRQNLQPLMHENNISRPFFFDISSRKS